MTAAADRLRARARRICPVPRRTLRRLLILTASTLAGLLCGASPSTLAAEPGVNLTSESAAQIADVRTLGAHWVRMFATWPTLEPARGPLAPNWLAVYDNALAALPSGTKVQIMAPLIQGRIGTYEQLFSRLRQSGFVITSLTEPHPSPSQMAADPWWRTGFTRPLFMLLAAELR